jgi:hypothetical protein
MLVSSVDNQSTGTVKKVAWSYCTFGYKNKSKVAIQKRYYTGTLKSTLAYTALIPGTVTYVLFTQHYQVSVSS